MADTDSNGAAVNGIYAFPTSYAQQRLWFLQRFEPDNTAYNIPAAFRLVGTVNVAALEKSFTEIVRRHDTLRTTFSFFDGEPKQIVAPAAPAAMSIVDLRSLPQSERESELRQRMAQETMRCFDLESGPLFQVSLILIDDQESVLIINMHHIISDGWSIPILFREVAVCYEALSKNITPVLPDLPIQYADYAIWQRGWLQGDTLKEQVSYWKKQLAGIPGFLDLATDRPRPAVQSFRGKGQSFELSSDLTDGLKTLARKQGATLFMTLLAAFQALLYRYTGQEDIVVGSPIANRTRTEVEGLIGFFVNTLVLRANFGGNPTFTELLTRVRETALGAYAHQDLSFEKLVEELQPQRSATVSPLFQAMFVLQNTPSTAFKLHGLEITTISTAGETAKFDLTLSMRETVKGLKGSLQYSIDLFDEATIARMAGHWQTMLEGIVANPDETIGHLPILTGSERCRLLVKQNETQGDCPRDKCIHELFEEQANRSPHAIAAVFEQHQITYRELNARANQLAHYLRREGVGPNVFVGICVDRRLEMLVGLLGILKAGGAYVPLDPDYPEERLSFVLKDVDAKILITEQRFRRRFDQCSVRAVCLDDGCSETERESDVNLRVAVTPTNLAYVMYTSGSTGKPKGAAIRHESIVRLVVKPNYVTLCPEDTVAQVSNLAFDAATFEIWGALINGARLAIIPKEKILSSAELACTLLLYRVTCMFVTTALFNRISHEKPAVFGGLRYLLFGGEICDPDRVKAVLQSAPPEHLVHVYGPTETTTFATFYEVTRVDFDRPVPIGRPINATELILLDPRGQLVPEGIVGEIHIAGAGVASGYLNRAHETEMRFVPHPLRPGTGERVYRTGDLARWLADGNLEFVGRIDDQVKIRGLRIEPAEVSAVLNTHPAVKISYVAARRQISGDMGLTAYIVPVDNANQPTRSDLRRFLLARLPDYMVPVSYVPIEEIPLTMNGKVDTRALPEPRWHDTKAQNDYVAPRDETEAALCRIWSEVLGLDRIGIDDDFFSVGGHSLLAAKLFTRLDEEFGRTLPLGILFTAATIRELAQHYRTSTAPSRSVVLIPLRKTGTWPPIFAVPGVFGNVVGFETLAAELGPDQPFYGLQSLGLDGAQPPLDSIEKIARLYLSEICKVQRQGPYVMVGACFGATVAYEMARQLLQTGKEVAFLGLFDPTLREGSKVKGNDEHIPQVIKRAMAMADLLTDRVSLYRDEVRRLDVKGGIKYLAHKFRYLIRSLGRNNGLKALERELHQIEVYRANVRALDRYRRQPLRGRLRAVEIFETARLRNTRHQEKFNWASLWDGRTVRHLMPGNDSGDMVSGNNARVLAKLLSERLHKAFGHSSEERDARN